jgi:Rrf2 family protein
LLSFLGKACSNFFDLKQAIAEECRQPTRVITNCLVGGEFVLSRNLFHHPMFSLVALISRKGLLAIAVVVDVALQKDGRPISAKTLAARHGLPGRYLETVLQSLARDGILKSLRGPRGGYWRARERDSVTANDILRAAGTDDAPEEEAKSELVVKVILPVLSPVEQECGQALSRIRLDDIVNRATLNGKSEPHGDL